MLRRNIFLMLCSVLLTFFFSNQSLAYGPFASFFYPSSTCLGTTGGLRFHGTYWSSSSDNARVLCPVIIGKDGDYRLQGDIVPRGVDSNESSQKMSCRPIAWDNWNPMDFAGSVECTLGKGDKFMGIGIGTGTGGTPAQKAYFIAHPISGCHVTRGTHVASPHYGTISTSGSGTVTVRCPLHLTNQSHQKIARFLFSTTSDAICTIYGVGLYGGEVDFTDAIKKTNNYYLEMPLPRNKTYAFADCTFRGSFKGISY